jgi:hypothetical protein
MATDTMTSSTPPTAVVDLLTSLLEAELNSVFRFMGEGSPYLSRASAEVRRPLQEMVLAERRRAGELADLIESLGTVPTPAGAIRRDEQYLAFLSLQFLLPKLVIEKKLQVERYENAVTELKNNQLPQVPPEAVALVQSHLAELRNELSSLESAAQQINSRKKV